MFSDDPGHLGEILIEKRGDLNGREPLRDGREAANIGEESGDLASFTFKFQKPRIAFKTFENERRQKLAERPADKSPRDLLLLKENHESAQKRQGQYESRRHRIDQQL